MVREGEREGVIERERGGEREREREREKERECVYERERDTETEIETDTIVYFSCCDLTPCRIYFSDLHEIRSFFFKLTIKGKRRTFFIFFI